MAMAAGVKEFPAEKSREVLPSRPIEQPRRKSSSVPDLVGLDAVDASVSCRSFSSEDDSSQSTSPPLASDPRPSPRSLLRTVWGVALGVVAFLDFVSTVLPAQLVSGDCEGGGSSSRTPRDEDGSCAVAKLRAFGLDVAIYDPRPLDAITWLDNNAVYFGFAFSLMWCIQAFREARSTRRQALRERDRKRLLSRGESIRTLADDDDLVKSGYFGGFLPWLAFYARLFLQLLLVPAGFYVLLYHGFQMIATGSTSKLVDSVEEFDTSHQDHTLQGILNSTYQVMETSMDNQKFSKDAKLSVVLLLAKQVGTTLVNVLGAKTKKWAFKKGFKEGRKLGLEAVVRPWRVVKKAKRLVSWVRWAKYLAPLLGAAKKLQENVCDLVKKHRQRHEALLAMKIRKILWKKLTPEERKEKAARDIQRMYRSYRVRKARWALALIQCHKDELAAIRVQTVLRKMLQRARARIRQKRAELRELEAREHSVVRGVRRMTMSPVERKRLYELQDQIQKKKSVDRRLLLRPNTRFALMWKILFVCCVLMEITDLAVSPMLAKHKNKATKQPFTVATKLETILVPDPVSTLRACSCSTREREHVSSWVLLNPLKPSICPSDPWFCRPPSAFARDAYSNTMHFILHHFMIIVGVIVFLDVPIYFYTGEICPDTGTLIPKGFFDRWIAPGLLLQLLVNPQMESTSKIVFKVLAGVFEIGPIRVHRWINALFYPCLVFAFDFIENKFWVPAVAHVNRDKVEALSPSKADEAPPAVLRRSSVMRRSSIVTGRRSSLNTRSRRASLIPIGRPSMGSIVQRPRRSSCCLPATRISFADEKEKLL